MNRVLKNAVVTLGAQIVTLLCRFLLQRLFITTLGAEYLGYNAVFTNILQMLNMADFGIAVAVTSFLYKPIASDDKKSITALMYLYKKLYSFIGIVVSVIGVIILMMLPVLISDAQCSDTYLRLLFLINLVGTVSTYFLAYKRTLTIAQEKSYFINIVDLLVNVSAVILQIVSLIYLRNYIVYLVINVAKNIVSNIIIDVECSKNNEYLKEIPSKGIVKEYKISVLNYVKDVFISKVGAYIYYGTDNIIISFFLGSIYAGYLSNYSLVTTALQQVITQVFNSQQATYGNYIAVEDDKSKQLQMTDNYMFVNYLIANLCFVGCYFMFQPFVQLYYGTEYLLKLDVVFLLSINLALTILLLIPSQVFVIYKLYKYDKPIIIISALLNITISVVLVHRLGLVGVLIGTLITALIYIFSRLYVISKYVYDISFFYYLKKMVIFLGGSCITVALIAFSVEGVSGLSILSFVRRLIIVCTLAVAVPAILFCTFKEFSFLLHKFLPKKLWKFCSEKHVWLCCVCIVIMCMLCGNVDDGVVEYSANPSNKSLMRIDKYVETEAATSEKKIFHISIDDTIAIFKDIDENKNIYGSIFENDTLSWLKSIHEKYGVVVSCYVYYEDSSFCLNDCTTKYQSEFEENSDWLRFGFHTLNSETLYGDNGSKDLCEDYIQTVSALEAIVGGATIDQYIRLHGFEGTKNQIQSLTDLDTYPLLGLLTSDDKSVSYYLTPEESQYIYSNDIFSDDIICFISTDLRIEFVKDMERKIEEFSSESWLNQLDVLEVFTHEWYLTIDVKEKIAYLCEYCFENNYDSFFYEDLLGE